MSQFKYGSHEHPENEVNLVRMDVRQIPSPRGLRKERLVRLYLMGELQAEGDDLHDAIDELIAAYDQDYQDAGLYIDGELTRHALDNGSSVTGVRVVQRSWPKGDGAEYAVKRTFSITLEAIFPDVESQLLLWKERLDFIGNGGPKEEWVNTFSGPKKFRLFPRTPQRIVQRGMAIGYTASVLPPGPLFPSVEHQDLRELGAEGGQQRGQLATDYKTTWLYRMTSGVPLSGAPTTR